MPKNNYKIAHLTSAHDRYDTRIFIKMCQSLVSAGNYDVILIVADGKGNERKDSVDIYDVGMNSGGRLVRMTATVKSVFVKALELDCNIYHLHDPELMPVGLKLKKLGKKVIFDAHEDLPVQLLVKPYMNKYFLYMLSKLVAMYERYACKKFDCIISATPFIKKKFLKINKNSVDVNNFPVLSEFTNEVPWDEKTDAVCYVGGLTKIRGIREIVKAVGLTSNVSLNLAGIFSEPEFERDVKSLIGWKKVNEFGFLNRDGISEVLSKSKAGLVTLHRVTNYLDALPVKMFEYMAAGLPVISSDIYLWKKIVDDAKCGICVNPLNPNEIATAIEYICTHPEEAQIMGRHGRDAVLEKYNWGVEEKKLLKVYSELTVLV